MKNEIVLGCEVQHHITEVVGTVTGKCKSMNGSIQMLVQRSGVNPDGATFKTVWTDVENLKRIKDGIVGVKEPVETSINLGDKVQHFNGFEGVVIEKIEYINGCTHFAIMPKVEEKNKFPKIEYIPCQYLTVIETKNITAESNENGGPATNAPIRE